MRRVPVPTSSILISAIALTYLYPTYTNILSNISFISLQVYQLIMRKKHVINDNSFSCITLKNNKTYK